MTDGSDREKLLGALAAYGGSGETRSFRTFFGWDEERYTAARDALLADATIVAGRGRGGSVSFLAKAAGEANAPPALAAQEVRGATTARTSRPAKSNGGTLGFEAELFKADD